MPSDRPPPAAYVVDVDEASGKALRGTRRSASTKDKPKVSHRKLTDCLPRLGGLSITSPKSREQNSTRAQAVEVIKHDHRDGKMERRKSTSESLKSPRKSGRPPSSHESHAFPKLKMPLSKPSEDPSHYGIPTPTSATRSAPPVVSQPIPMRPHPMTSQTYAGRPSSYQQSLTSHGGYGPPIAVSGYYPHQQPQFIAPSFPPPSSTSYMHYAAPSQPSIPRGDYFTQSPGHQINAPVRPLSARFDAVPRTSHSIMDPISRTTSAFGMRDPAFSGREVSRRALADAYDAGYYEDSYASRDGGPVGRNSIRYPSNPSKAKAAADYDGMPPPPLPGILRRPKVENSTRPSDDNDDRHDYRESRSRQLEAPRPRRPSVNRNSISYEPRKSSERVRVELANNGRRRQSYYGQSAPSTSTGSLGYEDKLHQAASYQEDVTGPTVPLTAEVLRRNQRRQAGSSRSTKSSGSRDESDFRKSATTRTTRSGSGNDDENVTIKVTGQARVMVGGAQIDCNEGGEIRIERQQKSIRNGSERSSSDYGGPARIDDRRSRIDGPSGRSRMSSQHSYTRARPQHQEFF